jgi:hypothetical protein
MFGQLLPNKTKLLQYSTVIRGTPIRASKHGLGFPSALGQVWRDARFGHPPVVSRWAVWLISSLFFFKKMTSSQEFLLIVCCHEEPKPKLKPKPGRALPDRPWANRLYLVIFLMMGTWLWCLFHWYKRELSVLMEWLGTTYNWGRWIEEDV